MVSMGDKTYSDYIDKAVEDVREELAKMDYGTATPARVEELTDLLMGRREFKKFSHGNSQQIYLKPGRPEAGVRVRLQLSNAGHSEEFLKLRPPNPLLPEPELFINGGKDTVEFEVADSDDAPKLLANLIENIIARSAEIAHLRPTFRDRIRDEVMARTEGLADARQEADDRAQRIAESGIPLVESFDQLPDETKELDQAAAADEGPQVHYASADLRAETSLTATGSVEETPTGVSVTTSASITVPLRVIPNSVDLTDANEILRKIEKLLDVIEDASLVTDEGAKVINREIRPLLRALAVHVAEVAPTEQHRSRLVRVTRAAGRGIVPSLLVAFGLTSALAVQDVALEQAREHIERAEEGVEQFLELLPLPADDEAAESGSEAPSDD